MRVRYAVKDAPGEGEQGMRNIRERVAPFLAARSSFVHGWWLEDASTTTLSITVWDEDNLVAHERALRDVPPIADIDAASIRQPDARSFLDVVTAHGLERSGGQVARVAWFDPAERPADPAWVHGHLLPALARIEEFLTLILAKDPQSGRVVSLSMWSSTSGLESGQRAIEAEGMVAGLLPRPHTIARFEVLHEVVRPSPIA